MANVALTNILHGTEDGGVIEVAYGESVKALPKDVVEALTEEGLIGALIGPVVSDDNTAALEARVAELEAELAKATKPASTPASK